jgi:8-oxo-dGTP pyrophosphatase MutT (NUDIX family)
LDDYSELSGFDDEPAFAGGHTLDPASLGGPGAELSTGLVLTWQNRLVFGIMSRHLAAAAAGQSDNLPFIAIGGHLQAGEGWCAAAQREAHEEAGCDVSLGDSPLTYLCQADQVPTPVALDWHEPYRPLLIWVASITLQRAGDAAPHPVTMVNAVFRAAALDRPFPADDMATLLLVDWETLRDLHVAPRSWAALTARGARVIGQELPEDSLLVPHGSAFYLGQWLAWQDG